MAPWYVTCTQLKNVAAKTLRPKENGERGCKILSALASQWRLAAPKASAFGTVLSGYRGGIMMTTSFQISLNVCRSNLYKDDMHHDVY